MTVSALALLIGRVTGAAAGLATAGVLVSRLGIDGAGVAMANIAVWHVLSLLLSLNWESGAVRHLAAGPGDAEAKAFFWTGLCLWAALSGGLVAFALALDLAEWSVAVPCLAALRYLAKSGVALGRPVCAASPRLAGLPVGFLGLLWLFPGTEVLGLFALAAAAAVLVQTVALAPVLWRLAQGFRPGWPRRAWVALAGRMAPSLVMQEYARDIALAVAGTVLGAEALGRFALALTLAAVPGFVIMAVDTAAQGTMARALRDRAWGAYRRAVARSAALKLLAGVPAIAGVAVLSDRFPAALGQDGAPLSACVVPLLAWPLARMMFGASHVPLAVLATGAAIWAPPLAGLGILAGGVLAGAGLGGAEGASLGFALGITAALGLGYWVCRSRTGADTSAWAGLAWIGDARNRASAKA